jgi:hypothetical protein
MIRRALEDVFGLAVAMAALAVSGCSTTNGPSELPDGGADGNEARDARIPEDAGGDAKDSGAHGPVLVALDVSGHSGAPHVELSPRFSSGVHDYYVRCAAGANALNVSMTASAGSNSSLTKPVSSPSLPMQTVSVSVRENQAIVAVASDERATTEYWVRCLPPDFPPFQWVEHRDAGTPPGGYYLVGNLQTPRGGAYAIVLDGNGVPVWYYSVPTTKGVFDVASLVKGTISFTPWTFHASPYEIHQLDPWTTTNVSAPSQDEHELRVLANGDYLLIASPLLSGVDLTGLSVPLPDGGVLAMGPNGYIQNCEIDEVNPEGSVVWQWIATDHLDPAKDSTWPQETAAALTAPDGGVVVDAFHCNSIEVDPTNGNLLISARHMDSIFYIEKSTGQILWKMGGATYTKDDATYVPVVDPFHTQHDARFQPNWTPRCSGGSGQISLFDDETTSTQPARAVVYDVSIGPGDGGAATDCGVPADASPPSDAGVTRARVAWQYKGEVPSASMGSFRVSSDGSRVVGWGMGGTPNLVFTEVDLAGKPLVDLYFTDSSGSYRAIKVPLSAFEKSALRNTAGLP